MPNWFTRSLPALVLLLGQTLSLIHQADVEAHSHAELCSICVLAHGVDSALPPAASLPVFQAADANVAPASVYTYQCAHTSAYLTRAPPKHPPLFV